MITTRVVATAAGIMLMLAAYVAPVRAHHSTAMYDMSYTSTQVDSGCNQNGSSGQTLMSGYG